MQRCFFDLKYAQRAFLCTTKRLTNLKAALKTLLKDMFHISRMQIRCSNARAQKRQHFICTFFSLIAAVLICARFLSASKIALLLQRRNADCGLFIYLRDQRRRRGRQATEARRKERERSREKSEKLELATIRARAREYKLALALACHRCKSFQAIVQLFELVFDRSCC